MDTEEIDSIVDRFIPLLRTKVELEDFRMRYFYGFQLVGHILMRNNIAGKGTSVTRVFRFF